MVRGVPRNDPSQRSYGEEIAAGDASFCPRLGRQILEKRNRGKAYPAEFVDVRRPGDVAGLGAGRSDVRIVAGQCSVETTGEPKRSKCQRPLRIIDVIQSLPDTPLFRRITVERSLFGDLREEGDRFFQLTLNDGDGIVAGDLASDLDDNPIDIGKVMRGGFRRLRASDHGSHFNALLLDND